uniref:Uncharacterized protein n=1 Tax=Trypanosoma vivax (strain Y486) TaxID=1055687 RepID=G0TTD4_TRYVY|nr:hypothetical protein, unlikely [Trypanosoma vivax Y486]
MCKISRTQTCALTRGEVCARHCNCVHKYNTTRLEGGRERDEISKTTVAIITREKHTRTWGKKRRPYSNTHTTQLKRKTRTSQCLLSVCFQWIARAIHPTPFPEAN